MGIEYRGDAIDVALVLESNEGLLTSDLESAVIERQDALYYVRAEHGIIAIDTSEQVTYWVDAVNTRRYPYG